VVPVVDVQICTRHNNPESVIEFKQLKFGMEDSVVELAELRLVDDIAVILVQTFD